MTSISPEIVCGALGELYSCTAHDAGVRVRTPFLYPDGDVIDVFVLSRGDAITVSDLGETTRWLRMQSVGGRRSPKQNRLIEDICLNHGLDFFRGSLLARLRPGDSLAAVILRVAQGSLRTADLWFTMRTRSVETVTDEVEAFLTERAVIFERGQPVLGRSGRAWHPDFHTRSPDHGSLVFVLSTGSKAAARGVAEHVVAACYDLSNLRVGPEALHFVSLFDDTMDVWSTEDFSLVGALSQATRWSQPEEFLEAIAA